MRYRVLIPTFIVGFIFQLSLINLFSINGITPNLILCLVLTINYLYDDEFRSIGCGLVFGLLLDAAAGKFLGVYAFTMFAVGLLTLIYKAYFNYENKLTVAVLGFLGTTVYHLISCLILAVLDVNISVARVLMFIPIAAMINIVIMYLLYIFMIKKAKARTPRTRYERYEII